MKTQNSIYRRFERVDEDEIMLKKPWTRTLSFDSIFENVWMLSRPLIFRKYGRKSKAKDTTSVTYYEAVKNVTLKNQHSVT